MILFDVVFLFIEISLFPSSPRQTFVSNKNRGIDSSIVREQKKKKASRAAENPHTECLSESIQRLISAYGQDLRNNLTECIIQRDSLRAMTNDTETAEAWNYVDLIGRRRM